MLAHRHTLKKKNSTQKIEDQKQIEVKKFKTKKQKHRYIPTANREETECPELIETIACASSRAQDTILIFSCANKNKNHKRPSVNN